MGNWEHDLPNKRAGWPILQGMHSQAAVVTQGADGCAETPPLAADNPLYCTGYKVAAAAWSREASFWKCEIVCLILNSFLTRTGTVAMLTVADFEQCFNLF